VALLMNTWNFPFNTCISHLCSIIAAGNVCVLKNSENAPHSSNVIKKIVQKLDQESYICLEGGVETSIEIT